MMASKTVAPKQSAGFGWDEPAQAATPRGWLMVDGTHVGFYLDYGPDHYRSPHSYDRGDRIITFCTADRRCRDHQPGNILAVRYPNGPGSSPKDSRYVETVEQARRYVESGAAPAPAAVVCEHCGADDVVGPFEMDGMDHGTYRPSGMWWIVCRKCNRSSSVSSPVAVSA
jgi:hypothetical protein